jgi:hypothetical protein
VKKRPRLRGAIGLCCTDNDSLNVRTVRRCYQAACKRRLAAALSPKVRPFAPGLLLAVLILCTALACGRAPQIGQVASGVGGPSPSPGQASPSPPPSNWTSYSDPEFGFSLKVPPGFTVQKQGPGAGAVQLYRAYEPQYAVNGYPKREIEFAIYAKDNSSLAAWVTSHTGTPSPTANPSLYWVTTSNVQATTAASRDAVYFDAKVDPSFPTLHSVAFFWKTSYVFALDWWSYDSSYASTMESIGKQMISTFQG